MANTPCGESLASNLEPARARHLECGAQRRSGPRRTNAEQALPQTNMPSVVGKQGRVMAHPEQHVTIQHS